MEGDEGGAGGACPEHQEDVFGEALSTRPCTAPRIPPGPPSTAWLSTAASSRVSACRAGVVQVMCCHVRWPEEGPCPREGVAKARPVQSNTAARPSSGCACPWRGRASHAPSQRTTRPHGASWAVVSHDTVGVLVRGLYGGPMTQRELGEGKGGRRKGFTPAWTGPTGIRHTRASWSRLPPGLNNTWSEGSRQIDQLRAPSDRWSHHVRARSSHQHK